MVWLLILSALFLLYCGLFFAAVDAAERHFGGWAVLVWGFSFVLSLIGPVSLYFAWKSWRQIKPLREYVYQPDAPPEDGATVAVVGQVRATGTPLAAPLSGSECGAYRYQGTWSRRYRSGTEERTEKLVNASGYGLARLELVHESGSAFGVGALPELEHCTSEEDTGGALSKRLLDWYDHQKSENPAAKNGDGKELVELGARLHEVNRKLVAPTTYHYLGPRVADVADLTTQEERLPLEETVTMVGVLGESPLQLTGPLKAYLGTSEEAKKTLAGDAAQLGKVGVVITAIGLVMIAIPLLL